MFKPFFCLSLISTLVASVAYAGNFSAAPCSQCHADVKVLGDKHPPVSQAKNFDECSACHGNAVASLAASLHKTHAAKAPCTTCHEINNGDLTVKQSAKKIGAVSEDLFELYEELNDASVQSTARLHQNKGVTCTGCHGTKTPLEGAVVNNSTCESCHGSQEMIAQKTKPAIKEQNPHASHQGKLPCSKCHSGHMTAKSYCLECHADFNQKMPEVEK